MAAIEFRPLEEPESWTRMSKTAPTRHAGNSGQPVRVLFLDTGDEFVESATAVFEDEFGIDVAVASRLDDAFRSLESVDCVVTEIRAPEGRKLEVLREIRDSYPDLPYVVYATVHDDELVASSLAAGATEYLQVAPTAAGYRWLALRIATTLSGRHRDPDVRLERPQVDVTEGHGLLNSSLRFAAVTTSFAEVHGYESAELLGESWKILFPPSDAARLDGVRDRLRSGERVTEELTALHRDGSTFSTVVSLGPTSVDRFVCTVISLADRAALEPHRAGHERADVERQVDRLARFRTRMNGAGGRQDVCDAIVETVESGNEGVAGGVYLYDDSTESLRRRAASSLFEDSPEELSLDDDDTPAWVAFVEGERVLVTELRPRPRDPAGNPERARGVVVPIGSHGVLLAGVAEGERPTRVDHAFVRLVGSTAGEVLDRIDAEDRLEASERKREALSRTIADLETTVDLVRSVGRVVGTAYTRTELERRACTETVRHERYEFARIAEYDEVSEDVRDTAWAGSDKGYLESLDTDANALLDDGEPMACAILTHESHVGRRLLANPADERWRADAIARGYRSVVAVPLVFRERFYGGLAVYSRRSDAFDDAEREMFEEMGGWIGRAIHAIESKTALVGRPGVELEFLIQDRKIQFLEWARKTGCTVEFENVVSRPDGSIRGYFTVEGASVETILQLASRSPDVTDTRLVTERGEKHLFECTLTEESVVAQLLEFGVVPKRMSATEAAGRLVVTLPEHTVVREFVDVFDRLYPGSTLVRRQDAEYVAQTPYGFLEELESELTRKQFEALETAFVTGYFEVPRDTTGEEVATVLGITQPTFNHHLRAAQRKLLSILFDEWKRRGN